MHIGYAAALPLTRTPGRGAATVQEVAMVQTGRAEAVLKPPVPVATQCLPMLGGKSLPAATAQAASAYRAAKGAVSVD
ncbi:hypothetical protein [Primorskyibacter sp. 2E233]|uniref:hypothetical protein n=1 Tax=Primorskyibacter sp. 2E233 TaxID=3413431 RepID=UPI003BF0B58B